MLSGILPALSVVESISESGDGVARETKDGSRAGSQKRSGKARRGSLAVAPLSTVPTVYFDENFHLENPRTFDVVSERSDVVRPTASVTVTDGLAGSSTLSASAIAPQRRALATNAILQEKLSWYMDTVEVHLISSISTASSSFFAALGDLRELHSEATASVHKIQSLRRLLVTLDSEQAVKGLEIVRLRRRRDNIARLERAAKQMERVLQSCTNVGLCLQRSEVEAALEAVMTTERLMTGKAEPGGIDLRPVKSLEAVNADLHHLRWRIGKAFESRFVESLLSDARRHVDRVPPAETLRRFAQSFQRDQYQRFVSAKQAGSLQPPPRSSSLPPEYTQLSNNLRALLMRHLDGLQRAKHVNDAVQAYRDAVIKETKSLIRRNMPSDDDGESIMSGMTGGRTGGVRSSQDKSMVLARSLRSLGPADAEDLLVRIYTGVSELIRRLGTQQKMLLDVTMRMGETGVGGMLSPRLEQNGFGGISGDKSPRSGSPDFTRTNSFPHHPGTINGFPPPAIPGSAINMDISDLISSAVEIAQSQIVKIVKVRTEQVATYSPEWFLRYFTLNRLFTQECEAVSVRVGSGLQNAVSAQIREFLDRWQKERIRVLAEGLEKDKWAPKEWDEAKQEGLERICESATKDPEAWVRSGRIWELREEESEVGGVMAHGNGNGNKNGNADTNGNGSPPTTNGVPLPSVAINGADTNGTPAKKLHATIDDQKFILPESALLALKELEAYLRLLVVMPGMASEIAQGMLAFLKLHNSRTYQLILGAGATKTAGLKSITTKHLAMASQGLSVIVALVPYVRECVRRKVGASGAGVAGEFDKVKRVWPLSVLFSNFNTHYSVSKPNNLTCTQTYQQYQTEIHSKLTSIMSDRARIHVSNLKKMDWDRTWIDQGGDPEKYYMDTLCRETTVLHKVLSKHLPSETLLSIMVPVFEDYKWRLKEGWGEVGVRTEEGKGRYVWSFAAWLGQDRYG